MRQLTVADLKARIARLVERVRGLAREIGLRRGDELLRLRERQQYLGPYRTRRPGRRRRGWRRRGWSGGGSGAERLNSAGAAALSGDL